MVFIPQYHDSDDMVQGVLECGEDAFGVVQLTAAAETLLHVNINSGVFDSHLELR